MADVLTLETFKREYDLARQCDETLNLSLAKRASSFHEAMKLLNLVIETGDINLFARQLRASNKEEKECVMRALEHLGYIVADVDDLHFTVWADLDEE